MYLALYNEAREHLTNVCNVTYELTARVYDPDGFSATGVCDVDVNTACIAVLNDDDGNYRYACFVDSIKPEKQKRTVKGLDFKTLWDTDVLLDFTEENSFNGKLSEIFKKVKTAVFGETDSVHIPEDDRDTTADYGSYAGTYQIVNAYAFLKKYLKYYEYNLESRYDVTSGKILFSFVKCADQVTVDLGDFIHELTTTSQATNRTVATIKYDVKTPVTDESGNIIYTNVPETDEAGNTVKNEEGNIVYVPQYKPRPKDLATLYYYRTKDNQIVQGDADGTGIEGRLYPVRTKWFEGESLAEAQRDAIYELANARYVDNVVIDHFGVIDPIDLTCYPLYSKVELYYEGKLYQTLPISEKITKLDESGEHTKIKLGFKKILLTEIIKQ